jgi:hypothetical protein
MTTKNFIIAIIAICSVGITNIAVCASAYNSHGKLEDELPYIIIGIFSGISLFMFINWLFKPRFNKASKTAKRRR